MKINGTRLNRKFLLTAAAVLIALILGVYTTVVYHFEREWCYERGISSLSGCLKDVSSNLKRKMTFGDELNRLICERHYIEMRIMMLDMLNMTDESVEKLIMNADKYTDTFDYYELNEELVVVAEKSDTPLSLSQEELTQLTQDGTAAFSGRCYISQKIDGYYCILACDTDYDITSVLDYDLTKLVCYIIWDNATGEVLESNLAQYGMDTCAISLADIGTTALKKTDGTSARLVTLNGVRYFATECVMSVDDTEVTVCTLSEEAPYHRKAVFNTIVAAILGALFTGCCIWILYRLRRKNFVHEGNEGIQLPLYARQVRRTVIATTLLFIFISTLLSSMQFILQMSGEVEEAFANTSLLSEEYAENQERIFNSANEAGMEYLDDIVEALNYRYEMDTDEWLKEMAAIVEASEITLYDASGRIVHSTTPYEGYYLTKCETDAEYCLWSILNGSDKHMIFYSEEEQCTYMAARRTDEVGMLLIVFKGDSLLTLIDQIEFADIFSIEDFPDGCRLYYKQEGSETLYVSESGNGILKTVTNTLPIVDDAENIIGMCNIDGKYYLYVNSSHTNWIFAFAYPVKDIAASALLLTVISAVVYSAIAFVLMIAFKKADEQSGGETAIAENFSTARRNVFRQISSALAIASAAVLLLNGVVCDDNCGLFEFCEYWEKGFNIITLSFIALSLSICIGLIQLIVFLNDLICKVLSAKWKTICSLLTSLACVVIFVIFLVSALEQLGVDAVSITASLGLTGLALSIGSKDVISDLVAGLFVAFEGQIQLGDYVDINGFFGEIVSMGIRTVKLKRFNKEMIVNNSDIKNVLNNSKGTSAATFTVVLPMDTDLEQIKRLTDESEERFFRACNGRLANKVMAYGVSGFRAYGMEYMFMGFALPQYKDSCITKCRTEMLKILMENGIKPATGDPLDDPL